MDKKKQKEEEKKKKEEKIIQLLDELKKIDNVDESEAKIIEATLSSILVNIHRSKIKKILMFCSTFFIHLLMYFTIGLILIGFLFSNIAFNNKYLIFFVVFIVSLVLTGYEYLPSFSKKGISFSYFFVFVLIIINFYLLNNIYPIFNFSSIWIFYLIGIELFYLLFSFIILKNKLL